MCRNVPRVWRSFFKKDPAHFPESVIAGSYGCCLVLPYSRSAPRCSGGAGMRLPLLTMMKEPDRPFGHVSGIAYREETEELLSMLADRLSSPEGSFSAFSYLGSSTFLSVVLCLYEVQKERR